MNNVYDNPRFIALKTIVKIEKDGAYSNLALKEALSSAKLKGVDVGFVTSLVYGTVQYRITLDYIISKFSKVKIKKMSDYVIAILRMGVYQLMYLDRVPASAVVDESVKLANKFAFKSKGFINAVLRSVDKNKNDIKYPEKEDEYLSVKYSFPSGLVQQWYSEFGGDFTKELLEALNKPAAVTVSVNTVKTSADEVAESVLSQGAEVNKTPLDFVLVLKKADIASLKEYINGQITPQGLASALSCKVLDPKPGMRVFDMCAAPGGKSCLIASLMGNRGEVMSFDLHEHRVELIDQNAKRLGLDIIKAQTGDATVLKDKYICSADAVLIDAPCSGYGVIRKKPDIKYSYSEDKAKELAKIQLSALMCASKYLKHGGVLVYSTCTIGKTENTDVIDKFLMANPDFERVDITDVLPAEFVKDSAKDGYVELYPHRDNTDGFFICKLKKK